MKQFSVFKYLIGLSKIHIQMYEPTALINNFLFFIFIYEV